MRRVVVAVILLLAIIAVAATAVRRWYTAAFPELPPGVYAGVLSFNGSRNAVPWLVVRRSRDRSLAVAVGLVTVSAQRLAPVDPVSGSRQPLIIDGAEARLRLTGQMKSEGRYVGELSNPISQEQGTWTLVRTDVVPLLQEADADLSRWFSLWQELERIEGEIQEVQRRVDDNTASVENLHRIVSDEDTLRKTADVRLGRADSQMDAAVEELRARQQQLDQKLRDFDLAQRVSKEGRLVFLSRETIQRESRWIELTLQLLAPETSVGFDQALERAERVRALKQQIDKERTSRQEPSISSGGAIGKAPVTRSEEEEFYEHLR